MRKVKVKVMKYKLSLKVIKGFFKNTNLKEDDFIMHSLLKLIKELPKDEFLKLFNIEIIHGTDEELEKAIIKRDFVKLEIVKDLILTNCSLYIFSINTKE